MKLHSDVLTRTDLIEALDLPAVTAEIAECGSRKRRRGFTVYLSGTSPFASQRSGAGKAATWDQHGRWMARLFDIDPDAIIAIYNGRDAFYAETAARLSEEIKYHGKVRPGFTAPWLKEREVAA